ncbi:MAG: hypothetical protein IJX37_09055 [Oscillospiraceae bacterium]|nr:hypothetical protein [Oscillospiraceae bacterium]
MAKSKKNKKSVWLTVVIVAVIAAMLLGCHSASPLSPGGSGNLAGAGTPSPDETETILAAVPEQLRSNYFLTYKEAGCCKTMTGDIAVTVVMISDSVSTWDDAAVSKLQTALDTYSKDITAEAESYNANVSFTFNYYNATLSGDICSGDYAYDWQDPALKSAGLPELAKMHGYVTELLDAKEAPVVFAFNKEGRAYAHIANDEFLVLFSDEDFDGFQHELSHVFGAKDFYYPAEVKTLASGCFTDSIMNSGETADPLTAYLIGWTESLSDSALDFLEDTNSISGEYMEQQRENESFTGTGTKVFSYGTYTGDMIRGRCHGTGTMRYNNGGWYTGEWNNGSWSGSGSGKYIYDDGSTYEGTFQNGERHGTGTYTFASGSVYTGSWSEGEQHGIGTMQYANGSYYAGSWSEGEKSGSGTGKEIYDNGVYEGAFLDGKRHGQGTYTWSSGDKYTGQWANGIRTGYGTYTWADGTTKSGTWQDGQFTG